ncbi:hypothetical protein Gogos_010273 [Gossypium gossypioides]|uniref:Reverse transcriptase zinc-binding domain-containing protein n=1 Tax=Gossypium gossypioides TaxID=34282 RepID=A0A7J9BKQ5_GOSGO|nr:hypothetical protein [Gossypium gossypioides]
MESSLGQLPSYTWRSIWATKGIFEAGMCWRIGSGTKILAIPLPLVPQKDVHAWSGEATGEYTVRSAYKWLIHNHYGISTDGNFYPYSNLYKRLWNIDLPSEIKITTWRTMDNFLPTYANLYYQRLMNSANCPHCHNGVKIVEHVFQDCLHTKEI